MRRLRENQCRVCGNQFCCKKCRIRHENNIHAVEIARLEEITNKCVICCEKPLRYHPNEIPADVLAHIVQNHFPLHCRKCSKIYFSESDLQENWKCFALNQSCKLESGISIIINSPIQVENMVSKSGTAQQQLVAAATQTSPSLQELDSNRNGAILTPIIAVGSGLTKNIMDSASSFKNISSFNSSAPTASNSAGSQLARPTSTPMQQLKIKKQEEHFDSSSQVSSIHGSSSESEIVHSGGMSPKKAKAQAKLARTRGRGKMPVSATPLRQVMSKSIQRALAEHGTLSLQEKGFQPKKIFDSMSNSLASPLDLRTSPVLRRTHSEVVDRSSIYEEFHTSRTSSRKHIMSSSRRIITEDVIISTNSIYEKLETVYETCRSIDSSSINFKNEHSLNRSPSKVENILHVTPKPSVATLKNTKSCADSKSSVDLQNDTYDDDVFYTPKSVPLRRSYTSPIMKFNEISSKVATIMPSSLVKDKYSEEPIKDIENVKPKNRGRLWSLFSSVVRLASFGSKPNEDEPNEDVHAIPKRCASFTGVLRKPITTDEQIDTQQAKRKRTNTFDAYSIISPESGKEKQIIEGPIKKVKRIQGRRPIERMRKLS